MLNGLDSSAGLLAAIDHVETQRRAEDPLRQFQPHEGQARFIRAVLGTQCYENWAVTANRWGKTDAGVYCDAWFLRFGIPDPKPSIGPHITIWDRAVSGWVIGPDYQTLQNAILPKLFDNGLLSKGASHAPFIPAREIASWSDKHQVLRLTNGSILQCKSNEQTQVKFSAQGIDFAHFDEPPELLNYQETLMRLEAGQRMRVYGTCTLLPPEKLGGGITWIYDKIIEPFLLQKRRDIQVFGGSIYENPHLDADEIARREALYPEGSTLRRIRLNGEWLPDVTGARKYTSFVPGVHVRETGGVNPRYPLCWAWDFNVRPFCTVLGQYIQGRFLVHDEIVLEVGSIHDVCEEFRRRYARYPHEVVIYGDATAENRSFQTQKSSYTMILSELQSYGSPLTMRVPVSNPSVVDRVNAVNMALLGPGRIAGMMIDPRCVELAQDLLKVVDDGKGGIWKTSDPGHPYFARTHTSDALGYWVAYEQPVHEAVQPRSGPSVPRKQASYAHNRAARVRAS